MADYKETAVTGKQWNRCCEVHITNIIGQDPMITMVEEVVVSVGDSVSRMAAGAFAFPFNPAEDIQLRDPNTGDLLGATMSQAQMYIALYSLYMQRGLARDAEIAANAEADRLADEAAAAGA